MSCRGRGIAISTGAGARWWSITVALAATMLAVATPARGNVGYELDTAEPSISLNGSNKLPHGLAVDQANRRLYVAVAIGNVMTFEAGEIRRFESNGTAAGTFGAGIGGYYVGVAVDPATQGFYANEAQYVSQFGTVGQRQMDPFTSAGVMGTPFPLNNADVTPNIAIDSSSDIYYPNALNDSVQVYSTTGTIEEEISCTGCPGGAFGQPVSVAIGSDDDLYVVDRTPNRVLKFVLSAGSYVYASTLQTGGGAVAVAVDRTTDDVLVGALPGGSNYHILAYNPSGVLFDDFGAGVISSPQAPYDDRSATQMAVDETSHELYVGSLGSVKVFDKVTTTPPSVTVTPASAIGEDEATLNAVVNGKGHAVLECEFEYVEEVDFESGGFTGATEVPCSKKPTGSSNVAVDASVFSLSPETEYRYRVTATSHAGTTVGSDIAFTTAAPPPPPPPPPPPTPTPTPTPEPESSPAPPPAPRPAPVKCRRGFVKKWVGGKYTCVKKCPKGTIRRRVAGKYKCLKPRRESRANRRQPARANRH